MAAGLSAWKIGGVALAAPEDLTAARRRAILDRLRPLGDAAALRGVTWSESNGWIVRAAGGDLRLELSLHGPCMAGGPDALIVVAVVEPAVSWGKRKPLRKLERALRFEVDSVEIEDGVDELMRFVREGLALLGTPGGRS